MSEVLNVLVTGAIVGVATFGLLALLPTSRRAIAIGAAVLLAAWTALVWLGSGLVGPFDMRPMLVIAPLTVLFALIWDFRMQKKAKLNG